MPAKKSSVQGWNVDGSALTRDLEFKDFKKAFKFMMAVAKKSDEMDHHPEWTNVYNKVSIRLTTHDEGGVTKKDLELAQFINECAQKHGVSD